LDRKEFGLISYSSVFSDSLLGNPPSAEPTKPTLARTFPGDFLCLAIWR
jgi:hypothetical protein